MLLFAEENDHYNTLLFEAIHHTVEQKTLSYPRLSLYRPAQKRQTKYGIIHEQSLHTVRSAAGASERP
jgi:hypothetical protein